MVRTNLFLAASVAAGALGLAAPAHAQDDDLWGGMYAGVTAGTSWSDVSIRSSVQPGVGPTPIPPVDVSNWERIGSDSQNSTGFNGAIEVGYNWRPSSEWLVGVETDLGLLDIKHARTNTLESTATTPPNSATVRQDVKSEWIWTLRPRIGYVAGPWLFYGTGGLATTRIKYRVEYADTQTPPVTGAGSVSRTRNGWVAGVGAAYAINPSMSVKGEWLYTDFGRVSAPLTTTNGYAVFTNRARMNSHLVRLGLDWRF